METQNDHEYNQDAGQNRSGELHLPPLIATETQYIASPQRESVVSSPVPYNSGESNHNVFYIHDDSSPGDDDPPDVAGMGAAPFQMSDAMSPVHSESGQFTKRGPILPSLPKQGFRKFPFVRVLILVAIVALVIITATMAFAQSSSTALPVPTNVGSAATMTSIVPKPLPAHAKTRLANHQPLPIRPGTPAQPIGGSGTWIAQHLPKGWTNAGLAMGDALFGERTAVAFTDREMSLDYRSIGTRDVHGGTFTAATFVLTANAKARFAQNDVRMINNVFFDTVQQEKLIQSVVNAQPQLVNSAVVGQQVVAWVDVSFQLWQSKINVNDTRIEGLDMDPATNQPRTHHMMVLLLRNPQNTQGNIPPMGGTGWLVSTYALDLPASAPLMLIQPA